jgi:glycosyltransferase involved in cell wall biosynthesis
VKILAFPRDSNPYQSLLYSSMRTLGARVNYLGELTPSKTINLLLFPLELLARRAAGARLVHLHWVFGFSFPAAERHTVVRRATYGWFVVILTVSRLAGMRLVWTAHNVLPHEAVFPNDLHARRLLVDACDLVVAHSGSTLTQLEALGATPRKSAVIPHGPIPPTVPDISLRMPGSCGQPRRFLFFGRILEYKGVEDLLAAFLNMPDGVAAQLTVAGQCENVRLRARLLEMAGRDCGSVRLRFERVPSDELTQLLDAADVVVLPFRSVTTSGSAMLALSHGRPLIIPSLPAFDDIPAQATFRYDGRITALSAAVVRAATADGQILAEMSAAAREYANRTTWRQIAEITMSEMIAVLDEVPRPVACRRPASSL